MAGLEPLYTCNRDRIICADDAVVFLVHWVLTTAGYRCIGSGNQARSSDERSELLPSDWNSNNEVYTLRYKHTDTDTPYMLICIPIEGDLLVNFVNTSDREVLDLMVNISDHVNADQLQTFSSVYKDVESLSQMIRSRLLHPPERAIARVQDQGTDPLHTPPRLPAGPQPHWPDPLAPPLGDDGVDFHYLRGPDPDHLLPPRFDDDV